MGRSKKGAYCRVLAAILHAAAGLTANLLFRGTSARRVFLRHNGHKSTKKSVGVIGSYFKFQIAL